MDDLGKALPEPGCFSSLESALLHLHQLAQTGRGIYVVAKRGEGYYIEKVDGLKAIYATYRYSLVGYLQW